MLVPEDAWRVLHKVVAPFVVQTIRDVPLPAELRHTFLAPQPFQDRFQFELCAEFSSFAHLVLRFLDYLTISVSRNQGALQITGETVSRFCSQRALNRGNGGPKEGETNQDGHD